ncbi:hypothetical protein WJX74_003394 [Apatococcus lobatus]|uniref:alanine--glyoxylate transaminase n=2 Tax=Apatococcus TaxID=904362 RepID=A0AAW1T6F9_9CHLO
MGGADTHARPEEKVFPVSDKIKGPQGVIKVPYRILMGPGPSNAHPRILAAQTLPLLGHLHPPFLALMDEIKAGLQYAFQTESKYTLLISGTGHAGMELCLANMLEPGQKVIIGNNGIWGERCADMAKRYEANVIELKCPPGQSFTFEEVKKAVEEHKPALLFLCQGESSTGVQQSLAGMGELCHQNGALLLVDTVCSLGAVPFFGDAWGVDICYSGSQKALSASPGTTPFFMSQKAHDRLTSRKTGVHSYNYDLNLLGKYWGWYEGRFYHHTGIVSLWYGMREALAIVYETGLETMWKRHRELYDQLWEGLRDLGLEPFAENPADQLPSVNTIKVPEGIDWLGLNNYVMGKYNLEIAGGLGPSAGKVWRIGIMGFNATAANIALVIAAFKDGLQSQGFHGAKKTAS